MTFSIAEYSAKQQLSDPVPLQESLIPSRLVLTIKGNPSPPVATVSLTRSLGIVPDSLDAPTQRLRRRSPEDNPSQFITSDSLDGDDLISLWDKISLSKNEELVLRALRFLDPDIERIAAQATTQSFYGGASIRGGFIVKSRRYDQPIPIGSFGDGMWRLLAMAIAISQCKGGVLLIDEVDTGLHYSVLPDMWRLIMESAKDLDVQVFATTHSSDCIAALASVCSSNRLLSDTTTLQRVERNSRHATAYNGHEIMTASDRNIEVR